MKKNYLKERTEIVAFSIVNNYDFVTRVIKIKGDIYEKSKA